MKVRTLVLLGCALLALAACGERQAAVAEDELEILQQRQSDFLAALAAGDAERAASLFAEDGMMHVANMPAIEGRASIRRFYESLFGFLTASSAEARLLHVSLGGDLAYSAGTTRNEFRRPDGAVEYTGKYVLVWRKIDGEWLIALYAISSDEPAEGATVARRVPPRPDHSPRLDASPGERHGS